MRDAPWRDRYWTAILVALALALTGSRPAMIAAIALGIVQLAHVALAERSLAAFPSQVRVAYLALVLVGWRFELAWLHAAQVGGTAALLLVGYCPLARTLALLPWNLGRRPRLRDVARAIALPPGPGSIVDRLRVTS